MNSPDDLDIKQQFQALRSRVEMHAPSWAETWGAAKAMKPPALVGGLLKCAIIAAAAVVAITGVMTWPRSANHDLVTSLPPLFEDNSRGEMDSFLAFANEAQPSWPSDSFIPQHINLINP